MSWITPQVVDDDGGLFPTEEELTEFAKAQKARAEGRSTDQRRSSADEILDAVSGVDTSRKPDLCRCPLCGAATKTRGMTAMMTTITRRCTNNSCRNEYPVASVKSRTALPPVVVDPLLHGGPYPTGPNRGGSSAPPIDPNQPISRKLAEFTRRITSNED